MKYFRVRGFGKPQTSGAGIQVLVAPDKFKGTYSAVEIAGAIADGVREAGGEPRRLAVADGGDGTASVLLEARGGRWVEVESIDPLGRPIEARYARLSDGSAVVDVAEASGMWRLAEREPDPLAADTRGTGILIAAAAEAGASRIIVAPGGSATTDGGLGILEVLKERSLGPRMTIACDVTSTFGQAPRIFGPQKGADPAQVAQLEQRLDALAESAPRDPRGLPGGGSGGGLAGGLWAHHDAALVSGATLVLDAIGFDRALGGADLVITGEGRIDAQTALGKAVGAVARCAGRHAVPCHAIVGDRDLPEAGRRQMGISSIISAGTLPEIRRAARQIVAESGPGSRSPAHGSRPRTEL